MRMIKNMVAVACCVVACSIGSVCAQTGAQRVSGENYRELQNLASAYKDAGKYPLADSIYSEMIPLAKQFYGESSLEYSNVLIGLGKLRIERQLFAGVDDMIKTALNIRKQVAGENSMEYAEALNASGKYYTFTGKVDSAESALLKASETQLKLKGPDDFSYILSLIDLGTLKLVARKYQEAEQYFKRSVELGCKEAEPLSFGGIFCLSTLYATMGRYPEAKNQVEQYLAAINGVYPKEHPNYIAALTNLSSLQVILNEHDKAEQTLSELLKLCMTTFGEKHSYYIHILNNLSGLYSQRGKYEKAEPLAEKALSIRKDLFGENHPEVISSLNNLASLYLRTGNYAKATQTATEAIGIIGRTTGKSSIEYIRLCNVLASIHIRQKEFEQAYPLLMQADSLLTTIEGGHAELELAILHNLNSVLFNIDSIEENVLEERLIEVIEKKKRLVGENDSYYQSVSNLASFYDEKEKHAQARALYDSLLTDVEQNIGTESLLYHNILLNSSINYELMDSIRQARLSFESYLQLSKDRVRSNFSYMPENERELYWKTLNDHIKRCQSFADRYKAKDPALGYLAYNCELFSKNLLLSSSQTVRQAILGSNDDRLIANWNKLTAFKNNPENHADSIRILEKELLTGSKEYRRRESDFSITWEEVARSLETDEAAIEFITYEQPDTNGKTERIYAALVLRPNGSQAQISLLTICNEALLKQTLQSFDYDFEKIYSLVWDSIDKELTGIKRIYLSPAGLLNSVPFAAIKNNGKYISDQYSIHTVLSTKDVISLKNDSTHSSNGHAVLFGGADFGLPASELQAYQKERGQGFDYLPGSKQEVERISKILSKLNWKVSAYMDDQATETNLKSCVYRDSPALLHISTHGYYFPLANEPDRKDTRSGSTGSSKFYKLSDNPFMRCGLLFSGANTAWSGQKPAETTDDGILTAHEISNLQLAYTELVVLSACETGLGDVDYSEGVYGLQRAFRLAGAKSMIVSLWKVADKDALEFMVKFYREWAICKNKKEAFDKTQESMRKKHEEVRKWAGFILIE